MPPPPEVIPRASMLFFSLDVVSFLALLMLCYFLYRALLISKIKLFAFFFFGFAALAAGEFAHILVLLTAFTTGASGLRILFLTHAIGVIPQIAESIALLFIAAGYTLETRSKLLEVFVLLQFRRTWFSEFYLTSIINTALLVYIVINSLSVYFASRKKQASFPAIAFSLMLLSNALLIPSLLLADELLFLLSKLLHILGLLVLMLLAVEVSRA
ncbi:MAG: hypothetical protein ABWK01_09745 [Infirmifilum sp.]